jgi:hypothetical protein
MAGLPFSAHSRHPRHRRHSRVGGNPVFNVGGVQRSPGTRPTPSPPGSRPQPGVSHSSLSCVGRIPNALCLRRRWRATTWTATVGGCRAVVVPSDRGHIRVWVDSAEGQGGTRERRCDMGHGACPRGARWPKAPPLRCCSRGWKTWIPACAGMTELRSGNDGGGGDDRYAPSSVPQTVSSPLVSMKRMTSSSPCCVFRLVIT